MGQGDEPRPFRSGLSLRARAFPGKGAVRCVAPAPFALPGGGAFFVSRGFAGGMKNRAGTRGTGAVCGGTDARVRLRHQPRLAA